MLIPAPLLLALSACFVAACVCSLVSLLTDRDGWFTAAECFWLAEVILVLAAAMWSALGGL